MPREDSLGILWRSCVSTRLASPTKSSEVEARSHRTGALGLWAPEILTTGRADDVSLIEDLLSA